MKVLLHHFAEPARKFVALHFNKSLSRSELAHIMHSSSRASGVSRLTVKIKKKIIEVFSCFDSMILICGIYHGWELPSFPALDLLETNPLSAAQGGGVGRAQGGRERTKQALSAKPSLTARSPLACSIYQADPSASILPTMLQRAENAKWVSCKQGRMW